MAINKSFSNEGLGGVITGINYGIVYVFDQIKKAKTWPDTDARDSILKIYREQAESLIQAYREIHLGDAAERRQEELLRLLGAVKEM